ncbi:helix-turn-helix domain-containing protein [Dysgonomonas sp. 520]|uniref:helix-turn-helix domain-containing protein n=1 Tax=Dysgonomonas sp. 520 TaxID=2302931 RepID=UPI0013CFFABC|nr:helix-turn-helix transcriptional regulator [Dysgonomonas sp. 520]NDW08488.1 XRE family transcriptional regulator [Dysgonomonas sp. 520]
MEIDNSANNIVHHGRNIKWWRKKKGVKQEALADGMKMSQQSVSRYEQMEVIEEELLEKFANTLGIPVDYLKNMAEEARTVIFENNNIETNNGSVDYFVDEDHSTHNYNPVEEIVKLFERLLDKEQEKIALLQKLLDDKNKK